MKYCSRTRALNSASGRPRHAHPGRRAMRRMAASPRSSARRRDAMPTYKQGADMAPSRSTSAAGSATSIRQSGIAAARDAAGFSGALRVGARVRGIDANGGLQRGSAVDRQGYLARRNAFSHVRAKCRGFATICSDIVFLRAKKGLSLAVGVRFSRAFRRRLDPAIGGFCDEKVRTAAAADQPPQPSATGADSCARTRAARSAVEREIMSESASRSQTGVRRRRHCRPSHEGRQAFGPHTA